MHANQNEQRFGRFELLEQLKDGVAGSVYRARDTESGKTVLLKIVAPMLSQNPDFGRYLYEKWADQQSLVEHPNVLRVWEAAKADECYYVAFEEIEGQSLSEVLKTGSVDVDEALDILHQTAEALRAIHRREVIHGHLKPSDVFLTKDGLGRRLVKVALLDVAVASADSLVSVFGDMVGTPKYMAPEVIRGRLPGEQADIFALGVIAYELVTGREPFPSEHSVGYLFANCQGEPRPADEVVEEVPHEMALVLNRMLEKEGAERYRTMQRLLDDLERCIRRIRTGRSEVVPYGTDSAFAANYELPRPRRGQGTRLPLGYAAVLLCLLAVATGLVGYTIGVGRGGPGPLSRGGQDAPRGGEVAPNAQVERAGTGAPVQATGDEAEDRFNRAVADRDRYGARGQYQLAVAAFMDVAKDFPDTPYAQQALEQVGRICIEWADSLVEARDYSTALSRYQQAIQSVPAGSKFAQVARGKIPSAMAGLAGEAVSEGRYGEALQVYQQIAQDYPEAAEAELLERKEPELLLGQAWACQEEGRYDAAYDALMEVVNSYAGTRWAQDAARTMPEVCLLRAQAALDGDDLAGARQQIRQLMEGYPGHDVARRARELDAAALVDLFSRAVENREAEQADGYFAELLRLYPSGPQAVAAVKMRLGLGSGEPEAPASEATIEADLENARKRREGGDFVGALKLLEAVLTRGSLNSPTAIQAAGLLPEWIYESALQAYGTGAATKCKEMLEGLGAQFKGSRWGQRAGLTLEHIQNAPEGAVYVPEGRFRMGTDMSQIAVIAQDYGLPLLREDKDGAEMFAIAHGFSAETPARSVETKAYFIDRAEVTNGQYKRFVDETGYAPPSHWLGGTYPTGQADYPVTDVTLADAQAYAAWCGGRLPTEQEWEKASRGVDGRTFPWGEAFKKESCHHMLPRATGPLSVGSRPSGASPYGCLDMIGNVMEWTSSRFGPYPGNELGPAAGGQDGVVRRGGSWVQEELAPIPTRCAARYPSSSSEADEFTGFRCVYDVPASPDAGVTAAQ